MKKHIDLINSSEIEKALIFCVEQVKRGIKDFTEYFPDSSSVDMFYRPIENTNWTCGFWTGEVWLAYEECGEESLKNSAMIQVNSFYKRIIDKVNVEHHDMGFLYSLSCVAAYKLTGNEKAKKAAILAADQLISRYQPVGEFIQAWGELGNPVNYRLIIDCLLNLPLLYWTSEVTSQEKYRLVAQKHIHTTMNCIFREDYSAYHTYFFDVETGKPTYGASHQGYRDQSAWARGQAWGIYGSALAYKYTRENKYIDIFRNVTDYYVRHLPSDMVPFWDLEFNENSDQPRDSSAAAIAVCGILEMVKYLPDIEAQKYLNLAKQMMKSLYDNYAVKNEKESNGLLMHGTYAKSSPYNTCQDLGVDECNIWGDYFYMEALVRLSRDWNTYW